MTVFVIAVKREAEDPPDDVEKKKPKSEVSIWKL